MKNSKVGIFWLTDGGLLLDTVPLDRAENYGDCKNYPLGHFARWEQLQRLGLAPMDVPYELFPRGRSVFNMRSERFLLLADPCILKRTALVKKIITGMELPLKKTDVGTDSHYRCYKCLGFETEEASER
jgi:hypothetical protein